MELAIVEGRVHNRLYREGGIAAHLVATSGDEPRLLVAFPAGNCGIALWLAPEMELVPRGALTPIERSNGMRGIGAELVTDARELTIVRALSGSLRGVRNRLAALEPEVECAADRLSLRRTMRDGRRIEITIRGARFDGMRAAANAPITLSIEACTDEPPLTPIPIEELTVAHRDGLEALAFLAYEEKLLAGSWRFLSYFGRDTLLTLELLMQVASERLIEAGLGAVLARLGPSGEVAHEEAVGEWPALSGDAELDHAMVDDDFLLAPVLASYFARAPERARALMRRHAGAQRTGLRHNFELVVARAAPYAQRREPTSLVAVRSAVGQWRDSLEGLGGGRFPYDVNAVLVPAALRACAQLAPELGLDALGVECARLLEAWKGAADHFRVELDAEEAQARLDAHAVERNLARMVLDQPVVFPALALDDRGAPLPILHSDESFTLIFERPSASALASTVERLLWPYPRGLMTPIGLLAANPAYCVDPGLRALFTERHYHGTVVWSWQQALVAIGLDRQLARGDLPEPVRASLRRAREAIGATLKATAAMQSSELWSFAIEGDRTVLVPFGQAHGHADESNAVQLWSTVRLALREG